MPALAQRLQEALGPAYMPGLPWLLQQGDGKPG